MLKWKKKLGRSSFSFLFPCSGPPFFFPGPPASSMCEHKKNSVRKWPESNGKTNFRYTATCLDTGQCGAVTNRGVCGYFRRLVEAAISTFRHTSWDSWYTRTIWPGKPPRKTWRWMSWVPCMLTQTLTLQRSFHADSCQPSQANLTFICWLATDWRVWGGLYQSLSLWQMKTSISDI